VLEVLSSVFMTDLYGALWQNERCFCLSVSRNTLKSDVMTCDTTWAWCVWQNIVVQKSMRI